MPDWQPIKTAPRDRWVRVWVRVWVARRWPKDDEWQAPYAGSVARWDADENCWIDSDFERVKEATHWQEIVGPVADG